MTKKQSLTPPTSDVFDLSDESAETIQFVISLALDGKLNVSGASEEASKRAIADAIRRRDADLAKVAEVANFVYAVIVTKQKQTIQ